MAQICHQNIIQIIDSFWYGRKFCIVMEFVAGENLLVSSLTIIAI
jgi:serine/threonine protein kinase